MSGVVVTDTEIRLRTLIVAKLRIAGELVTADASLKDDLGADSFDIIELIMEAEDEFQLEFEEDEDDVVLAGNFGKLCEMVDRKIARAAAAKAGEAA